MISNKCSDSEHETHLETCGSSWVEVSETEPDEKEADTGEDSENGDFEGESEDVESITVVQMEEVDEDCRVQGVDKNFRMGPEAQAVLEIVQEEPSNNDNVSPLYIIVIRVAYYVR